MLKSHFKTVSRHKSRRLGKKVLYIEPQNIYVGFVTTAQKKNWAKGSIPACITLEIMSKRQEMLEKLRLCCKDVLTCAETLVTVTVIFTGFQKNIFNCLPTFIEALTPHRRNTHWVEVMKPFLAQYVTHHCYVNKYNIILITLYREVCIRP